MQQTLIRRRDALRKALAGDLSMLKELREQSGGDVVDFALDSAQDEISSQLAESKAANWPPLKKHWNVCVRAITDCAKGAWPKFRWRV